MAKKILYSLIIITFVGFLLRIYGTNWGIYNFKNTYSINNNCIPDFYSAFGDEISHFCDIIHFVDTNRILSHSHNPLGTIMFGFLIKFFKIDLDINRIVFLRVIIAFFGTATIPVMYLIGKELCNKRTGVLSALLLSVMMIHVKYSHFLKYYIPTTFLAMISFYFSVKLYKKKKLSNYFFATIFASVSTAMEFVGALSIIPLLTAHFTNNNRKSNKKIIIFLIFPVIILLFQPNLLNRNILKPILEMSINGPSRYPEISEDFGFQNAYTSKWQYQKFVKSFFTIPLISLGMPFYLISIISIFYLIKKKDNKMYLVLPLLFIGLVIFGNWAQLLPRYMLILFPIFCLISARFLTFIKNKKIVCILLVILVFYNFNYSYSLTESLIRGDARILRDWIDKHIPPNSIILKEQSAELKLNDLRNKVIISDRGVETLVKLNPDYIILIPSEYGRSYRSPTHPQSTIKFYEKIKSGDEYKLIKSFPERYYLHSYYSVIEPVLAFYPGNSYEVYEKKTNLTATNTTYIVPEPLKCDAGEFIPFIKTMIFDEKNNLIYEQLDENVDYCPMSGEYRIAIYKTLNNPGEYTVFQENNKYNNSWNIVSKPFNKQIGNQQRLGLDFIKYILISLTGGVILLKAYCIIPD